MKTVHKIILTLFIGSTNCLSQGFINLNFESATITPDPASIYYPYAVYATGAIPGWTAYINGAQQTDIIYNNVSTGAAQVNLEGTNNIGNYPLIQGKYFILLQGDSNIFGLSAAIGQTGQIPITARSMTFLGEGALFGMSTLDITFGGQAVSFSQTGSTANYIVYTADVSAYAGQTGQLLFTALPGDFGYLDNIQFSTTPVPEPGELALTALGLSLLGSLRRQNSSPQIAPVIMNLPRPATKVV
jgi:hypothetical protein